MHQRKALQTALGHMQLCERRCKQQKRLDQKRVARTTTTCCQQAPTEKDA
jgi:hypothetical protein